MTIRLTAVNGGQPMLIVARRIVAVFTLDKGIARPAVTVVVTTHGDFEVKEQLTQIGRLLKECEE